MVERRKGERGIKKATNKRREISQQNTALFMIKASTSYTQNFNRYFRLFYLTLHTGYPKKSVSPTQFLYQL
jgi:hypothetical protein